MKKKFTPALILSMLLGLFLVTSCGSDDSKTCDPECDPTKNMECVDGKCQCIEGWGGENCDEIVGNLPKGNIRIFVKHIWKNKINNNYGTFAVLGRSKEDMYWFDYDYKSVNGSEKPKRLLKSYPTLKADNIIRDTVYSRKGTGRMEGQTAGVITMNDVEEGSYYLHVYDGAGAKYVQQVTVTASDTTDDVIVAIVQPLGHLKVKVGQSSIAGSEIDDNIFMLWGSSNDTFGYVMKKDYLAVKKDFGEPYFEGRTDSLVAETGEIEAGIYFLMDIPAKTYMAVAYNDVFGDKDGAQAVRMDIKIQRNLLEKVRLSFVE